MTSTRPPNAQRPHMPAWQPILFAALAGGMGWGIRGQYGHETGAMIAGLLVCLTLTFLLCPGFPAYARARAVAFGTVAMGFGGSMTYGQTLGLSHDPDLVGNHAALAWGLLGCLIKGGIWIGFAGVFFGMGLSGVRYRAGQIFALMLAALGAYYIGVRMLNYPFNPAEQELPFFYFSDDWRWEPDKDLTPRREAWGGLLFALIAVTYYAAKWRGDRLARNLAIWGFMGGALGFPLGQGIQAFHAWHPEVFEGGIWTNLAPHINWWNMMEITFGTVMGAFLGAGLWLNRKIIYPVGVDAEDRLMLPTELALLVIHVTLVICVEFYSFRQVDALYDLGLIMGIIPMAALAGGRWWPYLILFPVTLIPIAGKTLRHAAFRNDFIEVIPGWIIYVTIPLALSAGMLAYWSRDKYASGHALTKWTLVFSAWMFYALNFVVFNYPFLWKEWTARMPSVIIFTVCVLGLTLVALTNGFGRVKPDSVKN